MDRPADYLLHKYLRDPYYLNPVKTRRRKIKCPFSYKVGEQLTNCPENVHCAQRQKHSINRKRKGDFGVPSYGRVRMKSDYRPKRNRTYKSEKKGKKHDGREWEWSVTGF